MRFGLVLLLAAALAGCGSDSGANGRPDSVAVTAKGVGDKPERLADVPPPDTGVLGDPVAVPFEKPAYVDGRNVTLRFNGNACDGARWVEIEEGADSVKLTVRTAEDLDPYNLGTPAAEPVTCPTSGVGVRGYAVLEEPLGDRKLVDGAD